MEKKAGNAEGQVGDLARRLLLLEDNAINSEQRSIHILAKIAKLVCDHLPLFKKE